MNFESCARAFPWSTNRRLLAAGLVTACLWSSTGHAGLTASYKPPHTTTTRGELVYRSDTDYAHASFYLGRDRIEILQPTDRSRPVLVWANGWGFRLSPGFSRDWLLGRISPRDQQILRSIQAQLDDSRAVGSGLEMAMIREIQKRYGHLDPQGRDICDPAIHGGLFAAYGIGVIGTALGCALAVTGIGAAVCVAGIVGAVGGAVTLIISDQGCNPQGGEPDPPGDGGDGGNDDDKDPPECPAWIDPDDCVCLTPEECNW